MHTKTKNPIMTNVKCLKDKCNDNRINYFTVNQMTEAVTKTA